MRSHSKDTLASSSPMILPLGQHVDDLRFIVVGDVGCDDRIGTDAGARPVPVMDELLHGDVTPIMVVIPTGGVMFLIADPIVDAPVRWAPREARRRAFPVLRHQN